MEALVQQGGVSIGKRARWQLEINESRPLLVQFEIGIRGNGTQVVNAKSHGPAALVEARPNTTNETAAPNRATQSGGAMELSASGRDSGAGTDSGTGRGELRGSGLAGEGGPWTGMVDLLVMVDLAVVIAWMVGPLLVTLEGKGDVLMAVLQMTRRMPLDEEREEGKQLKVK